MAGGGHQLGPNAETGSINRTIASTTGRIGLLAASFAGGAVAVWRGRGCVAWLCGKKCKRKFYTSATAQAGPVLCLPPVIVSIVTLMGTALLLLHLLPRLPLGSLALRL